MLKRNVKFFYKLQIPSIKKQLRCSKLSQTRYPRIITGKFTILVTSQWLLAIQPVNTKVYIGVTLAVASIYALSLTAVKRHFRLADPIIYRSKRGRKQSNIFLCGACVKCSDFAFSPV